MVLYSDTMVSGQTAGGRSPSLEPGEMPEDDIGSVRASEPEFIAETSSRAKAPHSLGFMGSGPGKPAPPKMKIGLDHSSSQANGSSRKPASKPNPSTPRVAQLTGDDDDGESALDALASKSSIKGKGSISIKGAAAAASSAPNDGSGLSIRGRSSMNPETSESPTSTKVAGSETFDSKPATGFHALPPKPSLSTASTKSKSFMPLPFKAKTSGMPMPFASRSSSKSSTPQRSAAPDSTQVYNQPPPPNAMGHGYNNPRLAASKSYEQSSSTHSSNHRPDNSQTNGAILPSHTREDVRPPSPVSEKGKERMTEHEEGEMEEGEEGPIVEPGTPPPRQTQSSQKSDFYDDAEQDSQRHYKSNYDKYEDTKNDDRRYASHGGGHDEHNNGYRSPGFRVDRSSRDRDSHHHSSRKDRDRDRDDHEYRSRRRREDDSYRPRKDRDEDYNRHRDRSSKHRDRGHRSRSRSESRSRSRSRDRNRSRRDDIQSGEIEREKRRNGDEPSRTWRRGGSYSPKEKHRYKDEQGKNASPRAFHQEPGAPVHPSRELLPQTRQPITAANTPLDRLPSSLPPKPSYTVQQRHVQPPVTPFFLPSSAQRPSSMNGEYLGGLVDASDIPPAFPDIQPVSTATVIARREFTLFGSSRLDDYELEEKLGEGTFGVVHKARRKQGTVKSIAEGEEMRRSRSRRLRSGQELTAVKGKSKVQEGDIVALKKIVMHNDMDGVPITALREIRILKSLDHPNVVPVVDMAYQPGDMSTLRRGTVYMVFPYMAHDLAGLLENKKIERLEPSLLKLYARQLLEGTSYLHRNKVLHRDMKAANLLISNDGVLQIADFGLARSIEDPKSGARRDYTNCVVTRWYRPPELLLGLRAYGRPIDMWGVGCVIGEMFFRHPIFTGSSDLDQVAKIVQMCGTIDEGSLPGYSNMPESKNITFQQSARSVRREFSRFSTELADLLDKLLVLDPETRLTADEALDHEWFWTDPLPAEPGAVQVFPSSHEYDKRKAQEEKHGQGGERAKAAQEAAFRGPNQLVKLPAAQPPQPLMQPHMLQSQRHHMPPYQPGIPPQASAWGQTAIMPQNSLGGPNQMMQQGASLINAVQRPPYMHLPPDPAYNQTVQNGSFASMNGGGVSYQRSQPNYMPYQGQSQNYAPHSSQHHSGPAFMHGKPNLPPRPQATAPLVPSIDQHASAWDGGSYKRRRTSPGPALRIAGAARAQQQYRGANTGHADNLGGGDVARLPGRGRQTGAYDDYDGAPAGGAEPSDFAY